MEQKTKRMSGVLVALLVVATLGMSTATKAGVQELMRDIQKTSNAGGNVTMVWWMPQQFWEESLKANPALPEEARKQVLAVLADYTVIALMHARTGPAGLIDVQPKAELLKNVRVESNGKQIEPMAPEQIAAAAQIMLAQLKPAMAGMAGQVGQAMEFVVYPTRAADGALQFDAQQAGNLKVTLYGEVFSWRLPLGSLLPIRVDKKSGEEFPGNYQFNPFTGDKLGTR